MKNETDERDYFAEVHAFIDDTDTMRSMDALAIGLDIDVKIVKSIFKSGVCALLKEGRISIEEKR